MSILMGYKIYTVTNNMYEFAVKGNLPSRAMIRRDKAIINAIWIVSIADITAYIFLNTYWTFVQRNMGLLAIFNFANRLMQIALNLACSLLFFASYLLIRKVLNHTTVDRRQKNLMRTKKLVLLIGFDYAFLTACLVWGLYTQGFYDKWSYTNYILQNSAYQVSEVLLFILLANINPDFRLQTQVHQNGSVLIVAIDKWNKEVFAVQIKNAPKRKPKVKNPDESTEEEEVEQQNQLADASKFE